MIISSKKHPLQNLGKLPDQEMRKVGNGIQGNLDTVAVMQKLAQEYSRSSLVKRLATNIINAANIPSHRYLDEAKAIGTFVQKHIRYVKDPVGTESLQTPEMMIKMMADAGYAMGDCDDMALLIATLLMAVGIKPYFRCVKYSEKSQSFNHIYVVVYEQNITDTSNPGPAKRLVLDAIVKDRPIGFEMRHTSGKEYPVY